RKAEEQTKSRRLSPNRNGTSLLAASTITEAIRWQRSRQRVPTHRLLGNCREQKRPLPINGVICTVGLGINRTDHYDSCCRLTITRRQSPRRRFVHMLLLTECGENADGRVCSPADGSRVGCERPRPGHGVDQR